MKPRTDHQVRVSVTKAADGRQVEAWIDNQKVYSWKGSLASCNFDNHWGNPLHTLGIGFHRTSVTVLRWSVEADQKSLQRVRYERAEKLPLGEWVPLWDSAVGNRPELKIGGWVPAEREVRSPNHAEYQRIVFPVETAGEFDLRAKLTVKSGWREINFYLPLPGGGRVMATFQPDQAFLQQVQQAAFKQTAYTLPPAADVLWRVRNSPTKQGEATVEGIVNGNQAYLWSGPAATLPPRFDWSIGPFALGVGTHRAGVVFRDPELKLVSGDGWRLQLAAP